MTGRQDKLLGQALAGDALALQRLLLAQFSSLERHIAGRITPEHRALISAEDVLQDTFSQVIHDISQVKCTTEGEFAAWLRAVAEHRLSDAAKGLKRKKRGGGFRRIGNQTSSSSVRQLVDRVCVETRTAGRSAVRRETAQAVQVHVAALPDREREAIRSHYFDGKEVAAIADQMGKSPAAVRGLLHRAHRRLADMLGRSSRWLSK